MSLLLLLIAFTTPSHAITEPQHGPLIELGAGLGVTGTPVQGAVGGHLSMGWWRGVYDDAYAFGRYWALVSTTRIDAFPPSAPWSIAPMVELRRGIDIFVANPAFVIAGGPRITLPQASDAGASIGGTARTGLAFKWRKSRFWGLTVRLEAGVDFQGTNVSPAGGLLFGGGFARPARELGSP